MGFDWKDKQDGIDDILAEDINRIAHAIANSVKTIEEIAPEVEKTSGIVEDLNRPAGYEKGVQISLVGITTADYPENVTITDNVFDFNKGGTCYINYHGDADIVITANVTSARGVEVYIDNEKITHNFAVGPFEWAGKIKESISIRSMSAHKVMFQRFFGDKFYNGFMTGEQLEQLENTPTTEDVQSIVNEALGTVEAVFDEVHEYAENLGGDEA